MALHHYLMYIVPATPMGCAFAYYLYQAFLTFVSLITRGQTLFDRYKLLFYSVLFNNFGPALYNARLLEGEIHLSCVVALVLCVDLSRKVSVDAERF